MDCFERCGCDGCDEPLCWDDDMDDDFGEADGFEGFETAPPPRRRRLVCDEVRP
jgi:hypothetical protein